MNDPTLLGLQRLARARAPRSAARLRNRCGPPRWRRLAPILLAALLPLTAASAAPSGPSPNLYERIAAGPLVVHGRLVLGGKRAIIQVEEVLKGDYKPDRLQVSYRAGNFNRSPGSPKISFEPGDDSILVLEPEVDEMERPKGADRFALAGGPRGKIDLPAEGGAAILEAARRITSIQKLRDQKEVWDAERNLIRDPNPHLVSVGFDQILKFRLGDEGLVLALIEHLGGPRPEFRRKALRVMGQMFEKQRRTGHPLQSADLLIQETLTRATGDEVPETRAEAVRTLRELRRMELTESLRQVASSDPSQIVRYEAERALQDLKAPEPSAR